MSLATSTNPVVVPLTGADTALADAGVFYTALTPTPGTGVVGPVSTTFDETKALMTVFNGGLLTVYPKYLRLHLTVIGTTGTGVRFTQIVDQGNRLSSGGTNLVPNNTNMSVGNSSAAAITYGALVTTAASGKRRVLFNKLFKSDAIEVINETYQFSWGGPTQLEDPTSLINNAATLAHTSYAFGPVAIGPQQSFVIHQWRAAITVGITFEVEFGYVEK